MLCFSRTLSAFLCILLPVFGLSRTHIDSSAYITRFPATPTGNERGRERTSLYFRVRAHGLEVPQPITNNMFVFM
jgi:hypothetical protein